MLRPAGVGRSGRVVMLDPFSAQIQLILTAQFSSVGDVPDLILKASTSSAEQLPDAENSRCSQPNTCCRRV